MQGSKYAQEQSTATDLLTCLETYCESAESDKSLIAELFLSVSDCNKRLISFKKEQLCFLFGELLKVANDSNNILDILRKINDNYLKQDNNMFEQMLDEYEKRFNSSL